MLQIFIISINTLENKSIKKALKNGRYNVPGIYPYMYMLKV